MVKSRLRDIRENLRNQIISGALNGRFDASHAIVLTSSPRSGSTLLSQVLKATPRSCVLFEPLHLQQVPAAEEAGFTWRTYVQPELEWPQGKEFLTRVFEGRVTNPWLSREISVQEALRAERLIVKFVRANRLFPWLCNAFSLAAPIFLIRHPCAVIASQIKYGWANAQHPPESPPYLDPYPAFQAVLNQLTSDVEYLAALWALDQLPVLLQKPPHPWLIMTYEELSLRPDQTIEKICARLHLNIDRHQALESMAIPSSVVSRSGISGLAGWKNQLTKDQIHKILRTVNAFGIEFYDDQAEGNDEILQGEQMSRRIQNKGGLAG